MNRNDNSEDCTWTTRLKREAENQLPQFSPSLHNRVMQKALYRTVGTGSLERTTHRRFFPLSLSLGLAAAAIVLLLGISAWMRLQPRPTPAQTPAAAEINISALFPDPGRLIEQAVAQSQNQLSEQTYADLRSPARQLTEFVVRKITLF